MPTAAAAREAANLADAATEFREFVSARAELAAAHRRGEGSHFVKQVSFDEGSIARTGRSHCYHSNGSIGQGTVRFSYFWSERRPSRYMHESGVIPFVQANPERRGQAIEAMTRIALAPSAVKAAAERARSVLDSRSAAS